MRREAVVFLQGRGLERDALLQGIVLASVLIIAIGAHNASLRRPVLQRQHVYTCTAMCLACDLLLTGAGMVVMGEIMNHRPGILFSIKITGAASLFCYGISAAQCAVKSASVDLDKQATAACGHQVITSTLAWRL